MLRLWGKTAANETFHPAVFHLLDVGNVARELLSTDSPPRIRSALLHALGVPPLQNALESLPFIVALHDIGKISMPFQAQAGQQKERLQREGFAFTSVTGTYRHQDLSAAAVDEIIRVLPPYRPLRSLLSDSFAGHHGKFSMPSALRRARDFMRFAEPAEWPVLRDETVQLLLGAFPNANVLDSTWVNLRVATVALTGFIVLCDWLGSDQNHFEAAPHVDWPDYLVLSRDRAHEAVEAAGLLAHRPSGNWQGFNDAFPEIPKPRPLQSAINILPETSLQAPGLFIIEAPTGEGKTEAALALFRRLTAREYVDGLYFALPTMATSNQMFGRVWRFLNWHAGDHEPVKLIHGQALLMEEALALREFGDDADPESAAYSAPAWFAPKKRALLAPYGVGTVDQVELGVLSARHYVLRLFGLARKVVIVDEVHAYDTYMNTVIDHALWWLASLGTPVILLSATLPMRRHRELVAAYRRGVLGLAANSEMPGENLQIPYPALCSYTNASSTVLAPPADRASRELLLRFVPDLTPSEEARRLLDLIMEGGALCRITNTVRRAQTIFAALLDLATPDVELHLLHALLPGDRRLAREENLGSRLGAHSTRNPTDRLIVVGTQVLEQSLDYDCDIMVSDMAPVDLLLQRAGRLHRHDARERLTTFRTAVMEVVLSSNERGAPEFGSSLFVYEPWVLWKSWLVLHARQGQEHHVKIQLPADYRPLIEQTYDERLDSAPGEGSFQPELSAAWERFQRHRHAKREKATQRLIPDPEPGSPIIEGAALLFEEDEDGGGQGWGFAVTRDGQESISVIPLHRVSGGASLEPGGTPLSRRNCDRGCQLKLLRRAIRVSNKAVVSRLPNQIEPELDWFNKLPLLRFQHPLVLDSGKCRLGEVVVSLDDDLGLVIDKEDEA